MSLAGQADTRLTDDPAHDFLPAWSPDGARIAFSSGRAGLTRVFVMGADGSNPHPVGPTFSTAPDWSPDGSSIAFVASGSPGVRIAVMRSDGTDVRYLTDGAATDSYPNWSPDGRRLAFQSDRDGSHEIWTINADGSDARRLTSGSQFRCTDACSLPRFRPAWSPDGRQIAFAHDREGRAQIFVMNADGGGQRRVTSHPLDAQDVSWQPAVDLVAAVRAPRTARAGQMTPVRIVVRNDSPLAALPVTIAVGVTGPASIVAIRGLTCSRARTRVCRTPEVAGRASVAATVMLRIRRPGRIAVRATASTGRAEATQTNNAARATIIARRRR
jgi:Tol biopolymer transport system component